jgi:hypothetical protein
VNWDAIRAEYIGGGISQRKLAAKHGVNEGTLLQKAHDEGWAKARESAHNESIIKAKQKTAETASDNAALAAEIKRKGLVLLNRLFDEYTATATEHRDYKGRNVTDVTRLRDLTGAYRDLTGDIMPGATANNELLQSLLDMEKRAEP